MKNARNPILLRQTVTEALVRLEVKSLYFKCSYLICDELID